MMGLKLSILRKLEALEGYFKGLNEKKAVFRGTYSRESISSLSPVWSGDTLASLPRLLDWPRQISEWC